MSLFKSDLFRSFGVGFLIGALLVGVSLAGEFTTDIASPALASTADSPSESGSANTR